MPPEHTHTHSHSHQHEEDHFQAGDSVRDVVIGMSDGLTVPFRARCWALRRRELDAPGGPGRFCGDRCRSIAMGLGGYLAARGDAEHYASERLREEREVVERVKG